MSTTLKNIVAGTLLGASAVLSLGLEGCLKPKTDVEIAQAKKQKEEEKRKTYSQKVPVRIYREENGQKVLDRGPTNTIKMIWYVQVGSGEGILETALGSTTSGYACCLFRNREDSEGTRVRVEVNGQPAYWRGGGGPSCFAPWISHAGSAETIFEFYKTNDADASGRTLFGN